MEIIKNYRPNAIKKKYFKYPFRKMEIGDCFYGCEKMKNAARVFENKNEDYAFVFDRLGEDKYAIIRAKVEFVTDRFFTPNKSDKKTNDKYGFRAMDIGDSIRSDSNCYKAARVFASRNKDYKFKYYGIKNEWIITRVSESDKKIK